MSKPSIVVVEGEQRIPFLRGMVTQSLVERGLSFEEAYKAAQEVRDRIRKKKEISRDQLRSVINTVLVDLYGKKVAARERLVPAPTVIVLDNGSSPFSKGILSQSLQASGLEPQNSYAIAQQIQISLLEKGQLEITRDALRRLIYKTILDQHGQVYAERYLVWRYFRNPDRPLVLLFGGGTGVGKTSVATEMAHRLGIGNVVSTDTVREMMRMMFSRDILPAIHTSSFEAWQVTHTRDTTEAINSAFRDQAVRVLVGVRAIIERNIKENNNVVIEGVHIVPGLLSLNDFERDAYLIPTVISTLDKGEHLKRFPSRQNQSKHRTADHYRENFKYIRKIQDFILDMTESQNVPIIENRNLDETVASTLTVITSSLREKLQVESGELHTKAL